MDKFSLLIVNWYRQNKRFLPWRETQNPYYIWLSEIILQQTRVQQGRAYYEKFIENYPTVNDLAEASEEKVLNDWQGLGYYSRARNLHFSAKYIKNELDGVFPTNYAEIKKLKGVGDYTAAAISSFAFKEKRAVVDGNVYRLLSRVYNISTPIDSTQGKKDFQQLADELISAEVPDLHNQAIMEMGAMICTPKNPSCEVCPLHIQCLSRRQNTVNLLPVKEKKTKVRDRYFHYIIYSENGNTIIEKRTKKDIWQNLYQFPLVELKSKNRKSLSELESVQVKESVPVTHKLSHQNIHTIFHHVDELPTDMEESWMKIPMEDIQNYPLPRLIDRYLENHSFEK
jgi:A/G-specific adenine glycosylase